MWRHFDDRRAGIHDDGVAGLNELRGGFADSLLRFQVERRALVQAEEVLDLPGGRGGNRAAAIAQQLARFFQFAQIVANRDRGNAELLGQAMDVRGAVAFHQLENLTPAMLRHRGPGRRVCAAPNVLSYSCV